MNGEACCILQICCPPEKAEDNFAVALYEGLQVGSGSGATMEINKRHCVAVARWVFEHFDLAEKGTLQPLKDSIARLARG